MQVKFEQLYKKFHMVPVIDGDKAPLLSINKFSNKKIPLSEFKSNSYGIIGGFDGLEMVDIDDKLGNAEYLYNLIKEHCNVDEMPHCATRNKGFHIYYKCPGYSFPAQKLAQRWDGVKKTSNGTPIPDTMIETRGAGTYVLCPPTEGYTVINGDLLNVPRISKEERDFIISFCKAQNEYVSSNVKGDGKANAKPNEGNAELVYENEKSGERFNREGLSDVIAELKASGWKSSDNINWTRPGKKKGVSATLGKACSRSGNKLFHVFSTSTELTDENYTLFGIYTELRHNGDFAKSAKELGEKYGIKPKFNNKEKPAKGNNGNNTGGNIADKIEKKENDILRYIRVGNQYFKKSDGKLLRWSRQNILDDFSKDHLKGIAKYDSFVNEPNHIDYEPIIKGKFYNKYAPPRVLPCDHEGDFPKIKILLNHLFGENQLELIYDWIQISYLNPLQKLPIICLISQENETGKSGLGRLMSYIYGDNYSSIKSTEYRSEFNGTYIDKNVVSIEEGKMKDEDVEKMKKDSTDDYAFLREMHVDRVKIKHFAKYIITANPREFMKLTKHDNRFWIKRVGKFPDENFDPLFDEKVKDEVPYFLNFLMTRELHVKEKEGRFWIGAHRYIGEEFESLVMNSRNEEITDLYYRMLDDLENNNAFEICGSSVKIKDWYADGYKLNSTVITKALRNDFENIEFCKGRYSQYGNSDNFGKEYNGTYFIVTKQMLKDALGIDYEETSIKESGNGIGIKDDLPF